MSDVCSNKTTQLVGACVGLLLKLDRLIDQEKLLYFWSMPRLQQGQGAGLSHSGLGSIPDGCDHCSGRCGKSHLAHWNTRLDWGGKVGWSVINASVKGTLQ